MALGAMESAAVTTEPIVQTNGLPRDERRGPHQEVELGVVIPCLNEADTLAGCLEKAQRGLQEAQSWAKSSSRTTGALTTQSK
jgi:hypothetical protein